MSDDKDVSKLADELLSKQPAVPSAFKLAPSGIGFCESVVDWLWPGYIARRKITLLEGRGSGGKTRFLQALAACGGQGALPFGVDENPVEFEPWSTMFMGEEDEPEDIFSTVVDSGGLRERTFWWDEDSLGQVVFDGKGGEKILVDTIKAHQEAGHNIRLIICDPILEFCPPNFNINDNSAVKRLYKVMGRVARELDVAIVFIRHFKKGTVGVDISERGAGCEGWRNYARQQLHLVGRDDNTFNQFESLIVSMRNANRIVYGNPFAYCIDRGRIFFKSPSQVDRQHYVDSEPQLARYFKGVAPTKKGSRGPVSSTVKRIKDFIVAYLQEHGDTHFGAVKAAIAQQSEKYTKQRVSEAKKSLMDDGLLKDDDGIWRFIAAEYDPFADGFNDEDEEPEIPKPWAGLD